MKNLLSSILSAFRKSSLARTDPANLRCIVGLGNPGSRYRSTRHNVGFEVVSSLAESLRAPLIAGKGDYFFCQSTFANYDVVAAAPSTFMNASGVAVEQLHQLFGLTPSNFLIVYDDFQLPLGTLRFRPEGSDGGHNGMASVIEHLGTEGIPRLRVGIAGKTCPTSERKELMASYVLSRFEKDELHTVSEMIGHAREGVLAFVEHGIEFAMNNFNRSFLI